MARGDGSQIEIPEVERFALFDGVEPSLDMHLWLIEQRPEAEDKWPHFDYTDTMVVRAKTKEEARRIASKSAGDEGAAVWLDEASTSISQLDGYGREGIILKQGRDG